LRRRSEVPSGDGHSPWQRRAEQDRADRGPRPGPCQHRARRMPHSREERWTPRPGHLEDLGFSPRRSRSSAPPRRGPRRRARPRCDRRRTPALRAVGIIWPTAAVPGTGSGCGRPRTAAAS